MEGVKIQFYGDESEDKAEKVHAIGGFIGFADEWDKVHTELIARVKPTGISAYHMTDCECGWREFAKWKKPDRDQLTVELIEIICRHDIFLIGTGVLLDDYNTLPAVNEEAGLLGHDKWHMAFQAVLQQAAIRVDKKAPPDLAIDFFFDWQTKQGAARNIFEFTKNDTRLQSWRTRLGSLTFGHKEFDKEESVPVLQIADIAAVEIRKAIGNPITHPHLKERRSLARLKEARKVWSIQYLDKPVLDVLYELKRAELGLPNNAAEAEQRLTQLRLAKKILNAPTSH